MNTTHKIEAAVKALGYSVSIKHASTGSDYLSCYRDGYTVTVRVSDHRSDWEENVKPAHRARRESHAYRSGNQIEMVRRFRQRQDLHRH